MRRLYEAPAYGPLESCYWQAAVTPRIWPALSQDIHTEIAIIGAGYTGLNAACVAAQAGREVHVFDAQQPGWGASGRNGGFCCLGGAKRSATQLARRFGVEGLNAWDATEHAAVDYVEDLVAKKGLAVDRHSQGETLLAHSAKAWARLKASARDTKAVLTPQNALAGAGLSGPWYGALTTSKGFALHPGKYLAGLATAAETEGAQLYGTTPVTQLTRNGQAWRLHTPHGQVTAQHVLIATNGYSSDDLPAWLASRYIPALTRIVVTRPLTQTERDHAGWHSRQMCYDTRTLLHYFRLLPDNRFLFGMRGGLRATPRHIAANARKIRADFRHLFPAWAEVEITHDWSGLVCLMQDFTPFVGPIPNADGLWAALGYHGNGVAMGSYAGALAAHLITGAPAPGPYPEALRRPPGRFPLGRHRRALLRPAYWIAERLDR